ncbi:hypothetical protein NDR87_10705 [Nocardia sp. CDC159]|uniref:Uncharacterized protein n=1 Tax=Nocardia pulmonis TaxID=2951408 RepID=A0A9X2E6X6_9NOCA|nr:MULTISPECIES: hypothetical protein [Nocardia]MCM6773940.1 hypothetical protein [Nocardia pulmonis]MCM6786827.1 hypothetical protein [Nocardia sp. CDC159]
MTDQSGTPTTALAIIPENVQDAGRFVQDTAQALVSGIHTAETEIQL